ncbi:MAG: hypothetical protein GXW96_02055 [Christensenellaceae bacterium]|nr:hypothetical protein [Christensenellaceae bacterium]
MAIILLPAVVLADDSAAQIGEKGYASLQEAVDAAEEGQTITLLKDIVLDSTVTITSGHKAFTLDLNGKIINSGQKVAIRHSGSNTLTIIDSSGNGRGCIRSAMPTRMREGTIYLEGGAAEDTVLVIKSGSVQSITKQLRYFIWAMAA